MIKEAYFPTIIYGKDVNLDNRLFEKEVIDWSNRDKGVKKTNVQGWHSETNMHEIPVFKPLVDELFKMMNEVFKEEWLDRFPRIGNMWANINPPGGYNKPHVHPNSAYSGVSEALDTIQNQCTPNYLTITVNYLARVTDVSNYKVHFRVQNSGLSVTWKGDSAINRIAATFLKLGDI